MAGGLRTTLCTTIVAGAALLAAALLPASAEAAPKGFFGATALAPPSAAQFQRAAAGGVRSVRIQFYWGSVEPTPGARDWAPLDEIVGDAATGGVDLLPMLLGTPPWVASPATKPPLDTAAQRAAWAGFVRDLVGRYGPQGAFWALNPGIPPRPIRHWQVWNEMNLAFFWGGRPNPGRYAKLLRLTGNAIRSVDHKAQVIMGGLLPYKSTGAGSIAAKAYLQRFFRVRGARRLINAVAIHPYHASPKRVIKLLSQARQQLKRYGAGKKALWVTEFGWTTGGDGFSSSPFRSSQAQQARRVSKTYHLMLKQRKRLRLRRAYYFSLIDFERPGLDAWNQHMGLFNLAFEPKRAWYAYAKLAGGTP